MLAVLTTAENRESRTVVGSETVAAKEGADIELACPVVIPSDEDTIVSWTCDSEPANVRSSRIQVTKDGNLRIKSAKFGDSCNYRCEAINGLNSVSVMIKVMIVSRNSTLLEGNSSSPPEQKASRTIHKTRADPLHKAPNIENRSLDVACKSVRGTNTRSLVNAFIVDQKSAAPSVSMMGARPIVSVITESSSVILGCKYHIGPCEIRELKLNTTRSGHYWCVPSIDIITSNDSLLVNTNAAAEYDMTLNSPRNNAPITYKEADLDMNDERALSMMVINQNQDQVVKIEPNIVYSQMNETIELECRASTFNGEVNERKEFHSTGTQNSNRHTNILPQIQWLKEYTGPRPESIAEAHSRDLILLDNSYYNNLNWPRDVSSKGGHVNSVLIIRKARSIHSGRYVCFSNFIPHRSHGDHTQNETSSPQFRWLASYVLVANDESSVKADSQQQVTITTYLVSFTFGAALVVTLIVVFVLSSRRKWSIANSKLTSDSNGQQLDITRMPVDLEPIYCEISPSEKQEAESPIVEDLGSDCPSTTRL